MQSKLKVVWICHFSNNSVRSKLPLSSHYNYTDLAPWITQMINQFKSFNDIELHIIAPHIGLEKRIVTLIDENINYYFYRNPFFIFKSKFLQKWSFRFNKLLLFKPNRYLAKKIFNNYLNFEPDIINLIGFENPPYSPCILDIKKIPVLITVQGIYSNPERFKKEKKDLIRSYLEKSVIKRNKYYCIGASFFSELIQRDRKDALYFWNFFPRDIPVIPTKAISKEYDFVFFARVTQVKGIEDLIGSMVLVKKFKPNVSLLIMGAGDPTFVSFLKEKITQLGMDNNVTYLGEQNTMTELHRQALKASFYVLPTRLEGLAGSVLECMYMGLPVATTNAGGQQYLNKDGETVLMSNPLDIEAFASNMIRLLKEPELSERLIPAAKTFVENEFDHFKICRKFVEQYKAVINHYANGQKIPVELLFNPDKSCTI